MSDSQNTAPQDPHPLADAVIQACAAAADAVGRYGDQGTRDAAAEAIRAEVERIRGGAAVAVVVGEKKRGKSSLINALIGRRDLLPVEVDVATSVHLTVGYADEVRVAAFLTDGSDPVKLEPGEIAGYAAMDPATQQPYRDDVSHVEIGVPSPVLAGGLALVDTPGVGGLVAGHAQITLATLERADALLFVVSGEHELTASELAFLAKATGRIATVLFVLTQTDKYPAWQQVLLRNQELIRQHAARYQDAPWYAVSSRAKSDADEAAAGGAEDLAARRLARSGFPELIAALDQQVTQRARELRLGNALHVARAGVDPVVRGYERRQRSLDGDPGLIDEVRARETALAALQRQDAAWRTVLGVRMRELESALQLGFRRSVNDLRAVTDEKINTAGADGIAEVPADLEAGVRGVWMQLENATQEGLSRISAELGRDFGAAGVDELAAELELPERIQRLPAMVQQRHDGRGVLAKVERVIPAYGAGTITFTVLSLATGGLLLPVLAGLGVMAGLAGRRKHREELSRMRSDANRHLSRVIGELNTEVPPAIHEALTGTGQRFGEALSERLAQQRAAREAELAEYRRDLVAAQEDLTRDRAEVGAALAELNRVATRLAELADGLRP